MSSDDEKENAVHAVASHIGPFPAPAGQLDLLFREHYDRVFRTAYRITGNAVDAEDVSQTIFLRLAKRDGTLELAPSPGSYFHRAAVNGALDLVRARTRERSVPLEEVRLTGSESPDTLHESREVHEHIRRAVARLNPKAAELFILRYFEGYGNDEIARMLGMSKMVVGVLLHRARSRVRKDLGEFLGRHHETD
jgi:RNA polymerase sigma-70 factor, ECF subfamily